MKLYREISHRGGGLPTEIKEVTISKIGKKYFYLEDDYRQKGVNIQTLKYDDPVYTQSSFQLYRTREEIEERHERDQLYRKVQKHFSHFSNTKLSLEQLKAIDNIINNPL